MIEITGTNDMFMRIFEPLRVLADEAKLVFDKNGIHCRVVDPAHVSIVEINVSKDYFDSYKCTYKDGFEIGFDFDAMKALFNRPSFRQCKHNTKIKLDEERGHVEMASITKAYSTTFSYVDTTGMSDPKWPMLTLPWIFNISSLHVLTGMINDYVSDSLADNIRVVGRRDGFEVYQKVDNFYDKHDHISKYTMPKVQAKLISKKLKKEDEEAVACYPLDYFDCIIKGLNKAVDKATAVEIKLGHDYPMEIYAGNTFLNVRYLLAPRIESE